MGVLEGLKTGKSTLVGPLVGALVGDLVGGLVGPLVGPLMVPLVDPLVGRGSLSPALCVAVASLARQATKHSTIEVTRKASGKTRNSQLRSRLAPAASNVS